MGALVRLALAVSAAFFASTAAATAATPLSSTAELQPAHVRFADRIAADATVAVDRAAVDPAAVHVVAAFAPLDVLSGPTVERRDEGTRSVLRFRWVVACLSQDCVPTAARRAVTLRPVRVTATRRDGRRLASTIRWPALSVTGRVSGAVARASVPPFRLETALPAATYRASPRTLELALYALAAALVAVIVLLAARELALLRRRREEERWARVSPLERALLLAREAARREPADRRKALSLLARVLGGPGGGLGATTSQLAWAPPEPSAAQIGTVVAEIESELGER
jgi:hypothetical protein